MSEITKCYDGAQCHMRNKCMRWMAETVEPQSWACFYGELEPGEECGQFLEIEIERPAPRAIPAEA